MEFKISDPVLAKGQHSKSAVAVSGSERAQSFHARDDETNPKKRKREDPGAAKADPKLQEYLQVMGKGRESLVADETFLDSGTALVPNGVSLAPDGESDDEYVDVPKRQEKQRKIDRHMMDDSQVAARLPVREAHKEGSTDLIDAAVHGKSETAKPDEQQGDEVAKDATDDDWLRSRTNRLLDLVDPDDLPQAPVTQAPTQASVADTSDEQATEGHDQNSSHSHQASSASDLQGSGPSEPADKDSVVDAISRTSRLFVRNLPFSATEDDLRDTFGKFGDVEEVRSTTATGPVTFPYIHPRSFFLEPCLAAAPKKTG